MFNLRVGNDLDIDAVLDVYRESGLGERRPIDDFPRMATMLKEANLVVSAWDNDRMIGIARCLSDFSYVTYLADLAVSRDYQRRGVGRMLIQAVREEGGPQTTVLLLSAPAANEYYPRVGFSRHDRAWIMAADDPLR